MRNLTAIIMMCLCLGFVYGHAQGNDALAMGRKIERPRILSVEECKENAEAWYKFLLNMKKEYNPEDYNLLKDAKISDWTTYLGYDDLPFAVEFLFKRENIGVMTVVMCTRSERGKGPYNNFLVGGGYLTTDILKRYPEAEAKLAVTRLPQWIDSLKNKGYAINIKTPYHLYYFENLASHFFVVSELEKAGEKDEVVIDLWDGFIQNIAPAWKTLDDLKKAQIDFKPEPLLEIPKYKGRQEHGGRGSFPPGHKWGFPVVGVPGFLMSDLGKECAAVACTDVMMYWDNNGYLDDSDEQTYANDFCAYWGTNGRATWSQQYSGMPYVAEKHSDCYEPNGDEINEDASWPEAMQYFDVLTQELGAQHPIILNDYWEAPAHANCCVGFYGNGDDKSTWYYDNYNGRHQISQPLNAWRWDNKWRLTSYISGYCGGFPTVVWISPPNNAEDIPVDITIQIHFSKKMNKTSIESQISIMPDFLKNFQWTDDQKTLLIIIQNPQQDLKFLTQYTVRIPATVEDVTGKQLDGDKDGKWENSPEDDYMFSFTTREPKVGFKMEPSLHEQQTSGCSPPNVQATDFSSAVLENEENREFTVSFTAQGSGSGSHELLINELSLPAQTTISEQALRVTYWNAPRLTWTGIYVIFEGLERSSRWIGRSGQTRKS